MTGQFRMALPFTQGAGEKLHLDGELTGYWNEQDPDFLEIGWDAPPDQFPTWAGRDWDGVPVFGDGPGHPRRCG